MTLADPDAFIRELEQQLERHRTARAAPEAALEASGNRFFEAAVRIEESESLDRFVAAAARLATPAVGQGRREALLSGRWLGHALHPLLTDFPLGSWMSASLLDLVGGTAARRSSRRLLTFGLVMALPTLFAGWRDWLTATTEERRVGVVHAAVNSGAALLYAGSLAFRMRGRHVRGVLLGLAGGVVATAGGYLGGHLSAARDTALRATAGRPS